MTRITVVGGGMAGLVAAVACAEAGAEVELHEAHSTLGGRARTTDGPFVAHEGPHVFYADAPFWPWLVERGLVGPAAPPSLADVRASRFRRDGRLRAIPPAGLVRMLAARRRRAPVDQDFAGWAAGIWGDAAARSAAGAMGVVTYDHDPGRLSAAFVWNLLLRTTAPRAPAVRFVRGGWPSVIDRLATRARRLGVRIATDSRVDTLPAPPVIVATQLESARTLLDDASLAWTSGRCVLLDVGLRADPRDVFLVADLDEAGFAVRPSSPDPSSAPPGHSLVQADMPIRPGEPRTAALTRLERLLDLGLPDWRERTTWRRDAVANGRSGALDLPGTTWRDRPAVDRGDGVLLAGDLVAAPGMRGEVSVNSALQAAHAALEHVGLATDVIAQV
jgi:NAD(P)-binding Rossmann-like domain